MASIYKKRGIIYISWYDPILGKNQNKSTRLKDSSANMKQAKVLARKIEEHYKNQMDIFAQFNLRKETIGSAFDHFLKINQDKHPKTIKDYFRFFKQFQSRFNANSSCSTITKLTVEDWLIEIKKLPMQQNSIHGLFKQCRHFLNFLFEYEYIPMFKINRSVAPKMQIKEKIVFSISDIKTIFSHIDSVNDNLKTLIYLAYYTGLRSSDLLTIRGDHIDLAKQEIRYYSPKRKRYRIIAFHDELIPILESRIKSVGENEVIKYKCVENLGKAIRRYFGQIGISKKYSARTFRKTFITMAREYRMDASVVAELVGHEHQNTTDRFYNSISIDTMKEELRKLPATHKLLSEGKA